MHTTEITERYNRYLRAKGGNETRYYLGMSQISRSESDLLTDMMEGSKPPGEAQTALFAIGYDMERIIRAKLLDAGLIKGGGERHLLAHWSLFNSVHLFQGKTDGEWTDGSLLEIKSTTESKLCEIDQTGLIPARHYQQVQCYMHYGEYTHCKFLYQARDSARILIKKVPYNEGIAHKLTMKAQRVIQQYLQLTPHSL